MNRRRFFGSLAAAVVALKAAPAAAGRIIRFDSRRSLTITLPPAKDSALIRALVKETNDATMRMKRDLNRAIFEAN